MKRLNQDAVIAILLLMASGVLFWSTFSIRTADYGVLAPSTWPRVIILSLSVLSIVYLIQSLKQEGGPDDVESSASERDPGFKGWVLYWRNPIICFALFLAYLVALPVLGSLIGGVSFVFVLMGILGGFTLQNMMVHGVLSLATVGGMWAIFTYGLDVLLPAGMIFSPF